MMAGSIMTAAEARALAESMQADDIDKELTEVGQAIQRASEAGNTMAVLDVALLPETVKRLEALGYEVTQTEPIFDRDKGIVHRIRHIEW